MFIIDSILVIFTAFYYYIIMKNKWILILVLAFFQLQAKAIEGMWLPFLLKQLNEAEMKKMGLKIPVEQIYNINSSSLKDAVVQFNGGCTGEIISSKGLLLTNHHCGFGQIQNHSTLEHNYLENGFWAKNQSEELPNPGTFVTFIIKMEDITNQALDSITDALNPQERQSRIDKNLNKIRLNYPKESYQDIVIRPFYDGNQYILFITENFKDIRLVGAPPSSIGKFGADTDNWVWPRHTGDFSLFRIYADKNNRPAEYSKDNQPYIPKKFLSVSLDGIDEGDFTMVYGFPGRTEEYIPQQKVKHIVEVIDPLRVDMRDIALSKMLFYMKKSPLTKIQYADKYSSISNAWKKWQGEILGIKKSNALAKKLAHEKEFETLVERNPSYKSKYDGLLTSYREKLTEYDPIFESRELNNEMWIRNLDLPRKSLEFYKLLTLTSDDKKPAFDDLVKELKEGLDGFYKEHEPMIERDAFIGMYDYYSQKINPKYSPLLVSEWKNNNKTGTELYSDIFANSFLISHAKAEITLQLSKDSLILTIQNDPLVKTMAHIDNFLKEKITAPLNQIQTQLNLYQRNYMKAQIEVFPKKKLFPDANSTMRLTYGQVSGYKPADAVNYGFVTTLDGVMEKYVPGDYEFDVPEKLISLYKNKDYGVYGKNGKMPLAFIASNHTTGGNSGSPALDAYGNLIGLNFDRVWEGTMSDLYYDKDICRNIMVDARYILFIIDKYAGAGYLLSEMNLVHPKAVKKSKKSK